MALSRVPALCLAVRRQTPLPPSQGTQAMGKGKECGGPREVGSGSPMPEPAAQSRQPC